LNPILGVLSGEALGLICASAFALSPAAVEALRQSIAIQVSSDEGETALGWSSVPGTTCCGIQNHMDSLENHTFRISLYGKDALHPKNVLALGAQKFREPFVEFLPVAMAIAFDTDARNLVVVMVVMVLVLFLQKVRVDFHCVIKVKAADIENFGKLDLCIGSAVNPGHGVNPAQASLKRIEFCGRSEIALVEEDHVGEGDLFLCFIAVIEVKQDVPCIHERDDCINQELCLHLIVGEKCLHDGSRVSETRGFDENAIELVPAFHQIAEDADEVAAHGAADAAVVHLKEFLFRVDHEFVVDADLSKFIFDHGDSQAVLFGEDAVEQGGFACSEKAGENGDRNARIHCRGTCLNERLSATACLIKKIMTPLVLLVGFLGSGKTTFLKNLLPRLQGRGIEPHVVINDYQNAQVDAEQLRGLAAEIAGISGDCVCCGSREELVAGLEKFEHAPRRVMLVETNGTTDSEMLIEILSLERDLRHFSLPVQLSVIDAQRWQKRFWHNALEREQARTASHLFVSRSDVVKDSRIAEVEQSFEHHRVRGKRVGAEEFASELLALSEELSSAGERSLEPCESCGHHEDDARHQHHHNHSEHHFSSLELPLPDRVSKRTFARLLGSLPDEVIRAKGLVRFIENPNEFFVFQKVDRFDEPQFFPIGDTARINTPLALFIGPNLPEETLRARLSDLASSPV